MMSSTDPAATGRRVCGVFASASRVSSSLASASSQSIRLRGVITPRTGRSARRMMPEIICRSLSSITPAVSASATTERNSSSVTTWLASRSCPSRRKTSLLVVSSAHANGDASRVNHSIAGATAHAIGSGERSANCFGTSSPTISER